MQAGEFEEQFDNGASAIPFVDLPKADRQNRPKKQGSRESGTVSCADMPLLEHLSYLLPMSSSSAKAACNLLGECL